MHMKGILILAIFSFAALAFAAGSKNKSSKPVAGGPPAPTGKEVRTPSGLFYWDEAVGTGAVAKSGDMVTVHYTGWLTDGKKFDSSLDRKEPFTFQLGMGKVIKGWDEGVRGMKVGGRRQLRIPPELGYGQQGIGPIPPDATLIFEVQLLGVNKK